ncbi:carbohydrate-binding protein [Dactylosporangium sp. NPDC051485]|uniref:carbohydrate-binding protein n=1 Tax=Dactylosporangium sp. NPDC051485 TaxID=3154846 RepID=UPI003434B899
MRRPKLITGVATAAVLAGATVTATVLTAGPASAATGYAVAPYVDLSSGSAGMLDTAATSGGLTAFTAAFILGSGCTPIWGDTLPITSSTANPYIQRAQSRGVKVIISFGGAGGVELAQSCTNVSSLTAAYQSVINYYHVDHLDFDVEGAAIADTTSINRRFQAIKNLQNANPGLSVSLTIPVLESGPDGNGTNFLRAAVTNGVNVDVINAMTMDYGHAVGDMAAAAKTAAAGTLNAARTAGFSNATYANIGITPMIGNNDSAGEVVSQANAQSIVSWAKSNGVGRLAFWSIGRDQPCPGGGVSPNCSGLGGSSLDFTKIFFGGGTTNPPPTTTAPPTTPGGGGGGACNAAAWNASTAYSGGAVVSYNGHKYTAKWWTQGDQPDLNLGDGKPWTDNGSCTGGGGGTTTTPPGGGGTTTTPGGGGTSTAAPWVSGHAYKVGDVVSYNGRSYRCLQAHTSQPDWNPPAAPSLWQAI